MLRSILVLVRLWTALYTGGMPSALRDARRAEIESDLWESQHDRRTASDGGVAVQILLRLIGGIPDDMLWRWELLDLRSRRRRIGVWLAATAGVLLVSALWLQQSLRVPELPEPPALMQFVAAPPPPQPPPPPPPPPPQGSH